jgi:DNA repair ATPase RecN
MKEEELRTLYDNLLQEAANRELALQEDKECTDCASLKEELENSSKEANKLKDHTRILRQEWNDSYNDYRSIAAQSIENKQLADSYLVELCAVLSVQKGEYASLEDAKEKLSSEENLVDLKDKLVSNLDIPKIVDKIEDGMAEEPTATVDSPVETVEDSVEEPKKEIDSSWQDNELARHNVAVIKDYMSKGMKNSAIAHFEQVKAYKIFPNELEFESLVN